MTSRNSADTESGMNRPTRFPESSLTTTISSGSRNSICRDGPSLTQLTAALVGFLSTTFTSTGTGNASEASPGVSVMLSRCAFTRTSAVEPGERSIWKRVIHRCGSEFDQEAPDPLADNVHQLSALLGRRGPRVAHAGVGRREVPRPR